MEHIMYIAIKVGPERMVLTVPFGYGQRIMEKLEAVAGSRISKDNPNTDADVRVTAKNYDGVLDVLKQMDKMSYMWLKVRSREVHDGYVRPGQ